MSTLAVQRFNRLPWLVLTATALFMACSTTNTIEKRRVERAAAYASLSPEMKSAVDQGHIKLGMNQDAVYIAWGRPSEVLTGESASGSTLTWLYYGTQYQEVRYWVYAPYWGGRSCYSHYGAPYLQYDYYPRNYVRAEVLFEKDAVKSWRSLPAPP